MGFFLLSLSLFSLALWKLDTEGRGGARRQPLEGMERDRKGQEGARVGVGGTDGRTDREPEEEEQGLRGRGCANGDPGEERDEGVEGDMGRGRHRGWTRSQPDWLRVTGA